MGGGVGEGGGVVGVLGRYEREWGCEMWLVGMQGELGREGVGPQSWDRNCVARIWNLSKVVRGGRGWRTNQDRCR